MKRASLLFVTVFVLGLPSLAMADFRRNHSSEHSCYTGSNYGYGNPRFSNYNFSHGPRWNNSSVTNRYDQAIRNGIRTGQLSGDEVRELREDQRDIREKEAAYRSDGYLSPRERAKLQDEIQDFRGDLRHELNDGERRGRW